MYFTILIELNSTAHINVHCVVLTILSSIQLLAIDTSRSWASKQLHSLELNAREKFSHTNGTITLYKCISAFNYQYLRKKARHSLR